MGTNSTTDEEVYNKAEGEYELMYKISIQENDELFLQCLYDADGFLTTQEIRSQTGLDADEVGYRYRKFGTQKYVEILDVQTVNEPEKLPKNLENMNQARLTEKGRQLIDKGLIGNPAQPDPKHKQITLDEEDFEELQNEIDQLENRISSINARLQSKDQTISNLKDQTDTNKKSISSIQDWKQDINAVVLAIRSVFKEQQFNINFGSYVQDARKEIAQKKSEEQSNQSDDSETGSSE